MPGPTSTPTRTMSVNNPLSKAPTSTSSSTSTSSKPSSFSITNSNSQDSAILVKVEDTHETLYKNVPRVAGRSGGARADTGASGSGSVIAGSTSSKAGSRSDRRRSKSGSGPNSVVVKRESLSETEAELIDDKLSVRSSTEASDTIDSFMSSQRSFESNKANKLALWQSLCLELGVARLRPEDDLNDFSHLNHFSVDPSRALPSYSSSSASRSSSMSSSSSPGSTVNLFSNSSESSSVVVVKKETDKGAKAMPGRWDEITDDDDDDEDGEDIDHHTQWTKHRSETGYDTDDSQTTVKSSDTTRLTKRQAAQAQARKEESLPFLPTTLTACGRLLKTTAHVNLVQYWQSRERLRDAREKLRESKLVKQEGGQGRSGREGEKQKELEMAVEKMTEEIKSLVFASTPAMAKHARQNGLIAERTAVKSEWLNPLMRTVYPRSSGQQ